MEEWEHSFPVQIEELLKLTLEPELNKLLAEWLNGSHPMLGCVDLKGTVRFACPNHQYWTGFDTNELEGLSGHHIVHPHDRAHYEQCFEQLALSDEPIQIVVRVKHKTGEWIRLRSICVPYKVGGEVVAIVHVSKPVVS